MILVRPTCGCRLPEPATPLLAPLAGPPNSGAGGLQGHQWAAQGEFQSLLHSRLAMAASRILCGCQQLAAHQQDMQPAEEWPQLLLQSASSLRLHCISWLLEAQTRVAGFFLCLRCTALTALWGRGEENETCASSADVRWTPLDLKFACKRWMSTTGSV